MVALPKLLGDPMESSWWGQRRVTLSPGLVGLCCFRVTVPEAGTSLREWDFLPAWPLPELPFMGCSLNPSSCAVFVQHSQQSGKQPR